MCSLFDQFLVFDIRKFKKHSLKIVKKRINIDQYLYKPIEKNRYYKCYRYMCSIYFNILDLHAFDICVYVCVSR